jgi:outer membrane protein assembly factor BamD (BamD/ComL family)
VRDVVFALVAASAASAPMQCQSEPPADERHYEEPSEALYDLAQRFRAKGDLKAWQTTLETIIERYPNSRESVMAKDDLSRARADLPAP